MPQDGIFYDNKKRVTQNGSPLCLACRHLRNNVEAVRDCEALATLALYPPGHPTQPVPLQIL